MKKRVRECLSLFFYFLFGFSFLFGILRKRRKEVTEKKRFRECFFPFPPFARAKELFL
ncbi:unnamed protein product [Linum tenue]|nr:unnamed protein product [Linum tenue]CAI0475532.1 unnamed protein product [Linum tenue]CAI0475533.1 unnamed protein product [Linum tenue]CAI0549531.1 unnamed protein product [Linum tenue]CAI0549532.1 unnamed protein product [Linum tenue]